MNIQYATASANDFDVLAELRIEAMRESLEELGRFNRERSIERFRASFVPTETEIIRVNDNLIGFYSVAIKNDHLHLSHLYLSPKHQDLGIGSLVINKVIELSNQTTLPIRLGALNESRSNQFYQKHGFVVTAEDQWDTYYERTPDSG